MSMIWCFKHRNSHLKCYKLHLSCPYVKCKLMRIVLFNREWYFLRHFLTSRLRTNVQITRYMISAKDYVRCFIHSLKQHFCCKKAEKSKKFAANFCKKQFFLSLHQNAGRLFYSQKN